MLDVFTTKRCWSCIRRGSFELGEKTMILLTKLTGLIEAGPADGAIAFYGACEN